MMAGDRDDPRRGLDREFDSDDIPPVRVSRQTGQRSMCAMCAMCAFAFGARTPQR
jgi:hypothetical protein